MIVSTDQQKPERDNMNSDFPTTKTATGLFQSARRRGFWRRFWSIISHQPIYLTGFEDWYHTADIADRIDRGIKTISVYDIVGSVGRVKEFDRDFMPMNDRVSLRWRNLMRLWMSGVALPPIEVYQTDDGYFVIDGNHRVSISRFLGVEYIEAHIIQLYSDTARETDIPVLNTSNRQFSVQERS